MRTMLTMVNVVQIIISDIAHSVYITFKVFWNFSKLLFLLHILAFTKLLLRWCAPWWLWWTLFKSSFPKLSTHCISHLERFENYRNYSLFCTFWHLRNLYSGVTHHANYGERSSNHHFRHCAHCVYHDVAHTVYNGFTSFWNFSKLQFVFHILPFTKFLLRWCAQWKLLRTLFKSSFPTLITLCLSNLKCFETFRNSSLFCTFWILRSFHSDDAHHGNYGERCSNLHFRSWAHIVYHIYSVLKIIEISVCFAHFGFYEVSTPVMRTMLTMVNVVQIIISDVEHTLYITFTAFWKLSKLQFALHILAFTKFLLRWFALC